MRSFAGNFAPETIPEAVQFAHAHGVKVHVTVNTMPRGDEAERLPEYLELLAPSVSSEEEKLIHRLVKAADKIAAYIKCLREESSGNAEFSAAKKSTGKIISEMNMPEVEYFMEHFVPSYGYTLDRITGRDD